MKNNKFALLLFLALLFASLVKGQVHTVSAVPGLAEYSTLEEAVDVAGAGDTIYLYPGNYGVVSPGKRLSFIGPGFSRCDNGLTDFNLGCDDVIIGFQGASEDSGTTFEGVRLSQIVMQDAEDVIIRRCHIVGSVSAQGSNRISIIQNYVTGVNGFIMINSVNNIVVGNLFIRPTDRQFSIGSNSVVTHNVFGPSLEEVSITNSIVKNNIFLDNRPLLNTDGSTIVFNVINAGGYPGNSGFGGSFVDLFTYSLSGELQWQLSPTSNAVGAGENDVDCGAFSGDFPYQLSGLPPIPIIYDLDMPDNAPSGQPMNVNIKVATKN